MTRHDHTPCLLCTYFCYWLECTYPAVTLTFHVPNLMSFFRYLSRFKESVYRIYRPY